MNIFEQLQMPAGKAFSQNFLHSIGIKKCRQCLQDWIQRNYHDAGIFLSSSKKEYI